MSVTLGKLETQAFAYIQMRGKPTVNSADLARGLRITAVQTRDLLSRLARRDLIARVRRGLYLVPRRVPPGGRWSPSEFMALETLVGDRNGRYQVCGPTAFHRYGWDDQVPNRLYAYNNRLSGERRIGSVTLSLIKVGDDRLGGIESFSTPDGATAVYSSRARSLVDAVYDWSRFGSLPRAYQPVAKAPLHSIGAASRCAALFIGQILPVFSLFSPCSAGAPPISVQRGVSPRTAMAGFATNWGREE